MAFDPLKLSMRTRAARHEAGGNYALLIYTTPDDLLLVGAAGYFTQPVNMSVNDVIEVYSYATTPPTLSYFQVVAVEPVIEVVQMPVISGPLTLALESHDLPVSAPAQTLFPVPAIATEVKAVWVNGCMLQVSDYSFSAPNLLISGLPYPLAPSDRLSVMIQTA